MSNDSSPPPRIDKSLLSLLLSRLSPDSFERLILRFFNQKRGEPFSPMPEAGPGVFYQPLIDSYGGSLHSVFVTHHSPVELIRRFSPSLLADPALRARVSKVWKLYKGQQGSWGMVSESRRRDRKLQSFAFLTNLTGFSRRDYDLTIIPTYQEVARRLGLRSEAVLVGSYDSFVDLNLAGTREAFSAFLRSSADEISISVSAEEPGVRGVWTERNLGVGISRPGGDPLEPVFALRAENDHVAEFDRLIRQGARESTLEKFLRANFQLVFGEKYDRIETQIWLRFPELDISQKDRRLDVFLRNAVTRDWELTELKRSTVRLTSMAGHVPVLSRVVAGAIQQLRNYSDLLRSPTVRSRLAQCGIDYCVPTLTLVVGRDPTVDRQQWRWLVSQSQDVKIATYDELLEETKQRVLARERLLAQSRR